VPRGLLLLLLAAALWCGALLRSAERDPATSAAPIACLDSGDDAPLDHALPPALAAPALVEAPARAPLLAPAPAPTGRAHVATVFRPPRTHA
jgi:hypothetical protein